MISQLLLRALGVSQASAASRRRRPAAPAGPATQSVDTRQLISQFNVAFNVMSVIPLLTFVYLITVRFYSVEILTGENWVFFVLVLVFALMGLLFARRLLENVVLQLVEANAKLAKLNEAQASFVSNVAHEFRSPLAVFKGAMDNLADGLHGGLTEDQKEPVRMCQKEVNRLNRLVRDLLEIARIEVGKLPLTQEEIVLQDVLTSVGQMFSGLMRERGLKLAMHLPQEPARITGDPDRLNQVFVNLLGNAVKYTDAGEIRVRLIKDTDAFQVEVEDTGRGIAEEDLERVFDKFERVGTQAEEGSGLGLPIAKDIVELHRGTMWVESEGGRGSRFVVRLPARRQAAG